MPELCCPIIAIMIMLVSGFFGGLVNYHLLNKQDREEKFVTCIVLGIGASFLVPLFLKMISSDLLGKCTPNDLLVFLGFCLIAAMFSRQFIQTIGDKILKEAREAKEISKQANEVAKDAKQVVENQSEILNDIAIKESEVENDVLINRTQFEMILLSKGYRSDELDSSGKVVKILHSLRNSKFTFRTIKGMAKETNLSIEEIEIILEKAVESGLARKKARDGRVWYALTQEGIEIESYISSLDN